KFDNYDDIKISTPSKCWILCSIGSVTSSATTSGAAPGYIVMTDTFGNSISGIVSCFILRPAYSPAKMTMIDNIHIASLLFKEKSIIFFNIYTPRSEEHTSELQSRFD